MNIDLKIGDRTLSLANNALTPILYRQIFGKDFLLLFSQMITKNKGIIDKALKLQDLKAKLDAGEIEKEDFLRGVSEANLNDDDLSVINERADLMAELAFVMNKQAELSSVDKLLKLNKTDYYKFLADFNTSDLRNPEVQNALITFWQTGASGNVETKNA